MSPICIAPSADATRASSRFSSSAASSRPETAERLSEKLLRRRQAVRILDQLGDHFPLRSSVEVGSDPSARPDVRGKEKLFGKAAQNQILIGLLRLYPQPGATGAGVRVRLRVH